MPGGGAKPGERRGGRKKGVPNKLTGEVKAMVIAALQAAGGVDYLVRQAKDNPTAFLTLVGKLLPLQASVDHGASPSLADLLISIQSRRE